MKLTTDYLEQFETGLEPAHLERSPIPAKILGYGEISTVIQLDDHSEKACKRMPLFQERSAAEAYAKNYAEYCTLLKSAGLHLPNDEVRIVRGQGKQIVFYILQDQLPPERFCHHLLHTENPEFLARMLERIIGEIEKVWTFNRKKTGVELAIDGQLSNWVLLEDGKLLYIDTSTPLMKKQGEEQLDPELFLKSAPGFLRWLIRWQFLDDVMMRYYEPRLVYTDLLANLYKEQRSDLIDEWLEHVNRVLPAETDPLTKEEIDKYYREDKIIWQLFLGLRRLDRWIKTQIFARRYEFILPGKIKR